MDINVFRSVTTCVWMLLVLNITMQFIVIMHIQFTSTYFGYYLAILMNSTSSIYDTFIARQHFNEHLLSPATVGGVQSRFESVLPTTPVASTKFNGCVGFCIYPQPTSAESLIRQCERGPATQVVNTTATMSTSAIQPHTATREWSRMATLMTTSTNQAHQGARKREATHAHSWFKRLGL